MIKKKIAEEHRALSKLEQYNQQQVMINTRCKEQNEKYKKDKAEYDRVMVQKKDLF